MLFPYFSPGKGTLTDAGDGDGVGGQQITKKLPQNICFYICSPEGNFDWRQGWGRGAANHKRITKLNNSQTSFSIFFPRKGTSTDAGDGDEGEIFFFLYKKNNSKNNAILNWFLIILSFFVYLYYRPNISINLYIYIYIHTIVSPPENTNNNYRRPYQ